MAARASSAFSLRDAQDLRSRAYTNFSLFSIDSITTGPRGDVEPGGVHSGQTAADKAGRGSVQAPDRSP
jgi:hypothetical protein